MSLPLGVYGLVAFGYILFKIANSLRYSPYTGDARPTISVIIPEYNEAPELFERGLESILGQTYPIEDVWVIDDGSDDTRAWEIAQEYAAEHEFIHAHRLPENQGKRHAQAHGFERAVGELFVTMDSDTVLEPFALDELVKPFSDPEVMAATGYPKVDNADVNLLTRFIDMRYWVAFNVERAARSMFGTVVCCCGVLSAYRRATVLDSLDDYTSQTFLGTECTFGDDRHLTAHALQRGKVVYQSTAQSRTDAPTTLRGYVTQQTRWMRSFWRESVLALRWAPRRSRVLTGMLVVDLVLPFALVVLGLGSAVADAILTNMLIIVAYVGVISVVAYLRNFPYIRRRATVWALSPLYGVFYLVVLLPLSFYALATVTNNGWGTR